MLRFFFVLLFLSATGCASVSSPPQSPLNELELRQSEKRQVADLFLNGEFAALERLAKKYRKSGTRTPSGTWKLPLLYEGLDGTAMSYEKEEAAEWKRVFALFDQWIEQYPESPTPYIGKANALIKRGETFRGGSWASRVDPADMKAYRDFCRQAGEILFEFEEIGSDVPEWYQAVAEVYRALGGGKQQFLAVVNEGLIRFPDYDPLMFSAVQFLSAKWYGSDEELEAFIQERVAEGKASRGHELYARLYWSTGMRDQYTYAFKSEAANWDLMVKGMDDVLDRYHSQWNLQHFAWFACAASDMETASRYVAKVQRPIIKSAWRNSEDYYLACKRAAEKWQVSQQEANIEQ